MSSEEVKEEKVAIQKALLQLESKYGRPVSPAYQTTCIPHPTHHPPPPKKKKKKKNY